jgi:hypothetical protein
MRRLFLAAAALLLAAVLIGARWESWLVAPLAPTARFDARAVPAAPDYANPVAWTAHPDRADEADVVPGGLAALDPAQAAADVFYVDDSALNRDTDALAIVMGPENHHPIEYQLFWLSLRRNAEARVAAYLGAEAAR